MVRDRGPPWLHRPGVIKYWRLKSDRLAWPAVIHRASAFVIRAMGSCWLFQFTNRLARSICQTLGNRSKIRHTKFRLHFWVMRQLQITRWICVISKPISNFLMDVCKINYDYERLWIEFLKTKFYVNFNKKTEIKWNVKRTYLRINRGKHI